MKFISKYRICESTINSHLASIIDFQKLFAAGYVALFGSTGVETFIFLSGMESYFSPKIMMI